MSIIREQAMAAKGTCALLTRLTAGQKNDILNNMAESLRENMQNILSENARDMELAKQRGVSSALLDRLALNETRIEGMAKGLESVATLKDPVSEVMGGYALPNGLNIRKVRVPIGLIGIIYEARPNVTADAAGLCLKSGNAVILKGSRDALYSNTAIVNALQSSLEKFGIPREAMGLIADPSREASAELMGLSGIVDLLIPRGGAGLIKFVVENARVPVIETGVGNCHIYVDESANIDMAVNIVVNAKTSRPAVCNAAETLLVHKNIAEEFMPVIVSALHEKNVQLRGCSLSIPYGADTVATREDYENEFLDYIMAIKIVDSLEDAVAHIAKYGTKHSECIVTRDINCAQHFERQVDAAVVYVNASTRFTDGEEFGFGAEIGISTGRTHARGPMGLSELTTYKYIVEGNGQIR